MNNPMKRGAAIAALAASAAGIGGTALATSASAMGGPELLFVHNSATYSSSSSCNTNRSGAINTISRAAGFGGFTYKGSCAYNYSTHKWTYGHLTYQNHYGIHGTIPGDQTLYIGS